MLWGPSFKYPMNVGIVLNSWGEGAELTLGGPSERAGFSMEEWDRVPSQTSGRGLQWGPSWRFPTTTLAGKDRKGCSKKTGPRGKQV